MILIFRAICNVVIAPFDKMFYLHQMVKHLNYVFILYFISFIPEIITIILYFAIYLFHDITGNLEHFVNI